MTFMYTPDCTAMAMLQWGARPLQRVSLPLKKFVTVRLKLEEL